MAVGQTKGSVRKFTPSFSLSLFLCVCVCVCRKLLSFSPLQPPRLYLFIKFLKKGDFLKTFFLLLGVEWGVERDFYFFFSLQSDKDVEKIVIFIHNVTYNV